MAVPKKKKQASKGPDILDLRSRLAELEDTLSAIRSGEVDALIVNGPNGDHVYSLRGAEQPYRVFIEQMSEGAVTMAPDGTILYCNQRFADMIEVPLERVISTSIYHYLDEKQAAVVKSMLASADSAAANFMLSGKSGRALPIRIATSVLQDVGDDVHCAVVTDLTDQEQRKILSDSLAELQRSQIELQKQYQEVLAIRAKLEQANASKDEFMAALSHELRTPLTPVLLTANALAVDPQLPAELRADMETIRRNVELEAHLIDDLLDITRITRGKLKIVPEPTDIHDVIALAVDICQSDATAKGIHFSRDFAASAHFVNADALRLQQILWNLIRNAVKFTPESGQITITTQNVKSSAGGNGQDARPHVVISVEDTGIGIVAGDLDRVFNAFEQASGEITRRFGGLGLGLTISKRLVELHGGSISVSSAGRGKGSAFAVTLPTILAPRQAVRAPNAVLPEKTKALYILLVEDHDDTRKNMARLLTALNHTVVAAENAATAIIEAEKQRFDVVISDIGLPGESGLDLMRKLRAKYDIHGICLSGYGMDDDVVRSREAGFADHLVKPINLERLANALIKAGK